MSHKYISGQGGPALNFRLTFNRVNRPIGAQNAPTRGSRERRGGKAKSVSRALVVQRSVNVRPFKRANERDAASRARQWPNRVGDCSSGFARIRPLSPVRASHKDAARYKYRTKRPAVQNLPVSCVSCVQTSARFPRKSTGRCSLVVWSSVGTNESVARASSCFLL